MSIKSNITLEITDWICTKCGDSKTDQLHMVGDSQLCDDCHSVHETREKKLYIIKDYRIWAYSEQEAKDLLLMIENF
jgi:hypothetical protein